MTESKVGVRFTGLNRAHDQSGPFTMGLISGPRLAPSVIEALVTNQTQGEENRFDYISFYRSKLIRKIASEEHSIFTVLSIYFS